MSVPRVAICTPYYRQVEAATYLAGMAMGFACGGKVMAMPMGTSGCYIEDNRNGCVEYCLNVDKHLREGGEPGFDWLLWIDSDMQFPGDALLRLIAHDRDVVGVNYRQRTPPMAAVSLYEDGTDTHLLEPGLHKMQQLATGFLLTRFKIYREIDYPWFMPGLRHQSRDDRYFCNLLRERGYDLWCDNDLTFEIVHHDGFPIPWFRPDQLIDGRDRPAVVMGAMINLAKSADDGRDRAKLSAQALVDRTKRAAD